MLLLFSEIFEGRLNTTSILEIILGPDAIYLVTAAVAFLRSISKSLAFIPIMVCIQLANPVATVSIVEKACPKLVLSVGASVTSESLDFT
ncbi:MAG: hypothetical protein ACJAU2_001684 [Maribacter sp.]|jgi:hypothetical protein